MNSKLLEKLLIGSNLYRNNSINNLADFLDEAAEEIQKLNNENESLQKENALLKDEIHKVTSTLEIKAKNLAWWQNQFQSKSGVETKDIAAYFVEMNEKINTLFDAIKHGDDEHKDWLKTAINKHFSYSETEVYGVSDELR